MTTKKHSGQRLAPMDTTALDKVLGYRIRRVKNLMYEDFTRHLHDFGISPVDFSALGLIADNPGRPQGEIAAALGVTRANFATAIKSLDERGLTFREGVHRDRRLSRIYLTENGKQFVRAARKQQGELEAEYARRLGGEEERDLLLKMLARLYTNRD